MTLDEFRNALRQLLNDAIKSGLALDDVGTVAEEELHPTFDAEILLGS